MALECKMHHNWNKSRISKLTEGSYNGTSDLQLERMNVYFNEVRSQSWNLNFSFPNLTRPPATNMCLVLSLSISNPVPWMPFELVLSANSSVPTTLSSVKVALVR